MCWALPMPMLAQAGVNSGIKFQRNISSYFCTVYTYSKNPLLCKALQSTKFFDQHFDLMTVMHN